MKEITLRNQEVSCAQPCICSLSDNESKSGNETVDCYCDKVENSRRSKSVTNKPQVSKKRLTFRKHKQKLKSKKSNELCKCNEPNTTDKSITTYAEQGSCAAENERNTQTARSCTAATSIRGVDSVSSKGEVKTELWFPKQMSKGEQAMPTKSSEKLIGLYETSCSSGTCCCSTDTETTRKA